MEPEFEIELANLLNRYSKENNSDTPDFILSAYLNACLENYNATVNKRKAWHTEGTLEETGIVK